MKAVLFDMDGVLIDSEQIFEKIEHDMLNELGIVLDDKTKQAMVGTQMQRLWTMLKEKYTIKKSLHALMEDEKVRYRQFLDAGQIKPIAGALLLVKSVKEKGFKTAIVSSSHQYEVQKTAKLFGFNAYLDTTVSGEDVANGKPSPEPYLLAAKKLGVKPKDCLVIEDSQNGVVAAKQAGMTCIALKLPCAIAQNLELADRVVTALSEINIDQL